MDLRDLADSEEHDLSVVDLDLSPNEASGLLAVESDAVLSACGWDAGFWTVLDEGRVEDCLALVGRRGDDWTARHVHARVPPGTGEASDGESLARKDGDVWVFGSFFGSKRGPVDPARAFVARFAEDAGAGPGPLDLEVAHVGLGLLRLVNDGLAAAGIDVLEPGAEVRRCFPLEGADRPVNVEGATFLPDGTLVLGLRYPVTADGHPLLVGLADVDAWFAADTPSLAGVWVLPGIGSPEELTGVRDLSAFGDELHLVAGNLDATGTKSAVLADHPAGRGASSSHWAAQLPAVGGPTELTARRVRAFPGVERVEGLSPDPEGAFFYVSDEGDRVLTAFATGAPA